MKIQNRFIPLFQVASVACLCLPLHAAPFVGTAYEPFDYGTVVDGTSPTTDANLAANNRGIGWNATGDPALPNTTVWGGGVTTAPFAVASANIFSGSLPHLVPPVGQQLQLTPSTASGNAGRALGQSVDSGSLYCSFTVQRLNDSIRTINFAFFAGTVEKFGFGQYATATVGASSSGNLAAVFLNTNPGNLIVGTPAIPMGTAVPHLVIVRMDFNTNGVNDRVRVYVDPTSLTDETALTPYVDNANFDMATITTIRPFAGAVTTTPVALAAASGAFDEIRIGSTFASVTTPLVPNLLLTSDAGQITLSWPSSFSWCFLEESSTLSPSPWTVLSDAVDDGTSKSLSFPRSRERQFFRLARP